MKSKQICKHCKEIFYDYLSNKRKYCSQVCKNKVQVKPNNRECLRCGKTFKACSADIKRGKKKYCSADCQHKTFQGVRLSPNTEFKNGHETPKGENSYAWKGGRVPTVAGYIRVHHNGEYILEHRLTMEQLLDRKLESEEIVHHKNRIKDDNRIENLQLLASHREHMRLHQRERKHL